MQIAILAVGRMKSGPERELYARFADRFAKSGKSLHLFGPQLMEIPESRLADKNARREEEAQQLLGNAGDGSRIIMLDERGKDISSQELANLIADERDGGMSRLCFAIGGPDGHGVAMKKAAFKSIRLGALTWPHQIARILLAEQIYRASTILSNHPYHRQ